MTSILDQLNATVLASGAVDLCKSIGLRRSPAPFADGALHFARPTWNQSEEGRRLFGALEEMEACGSIRRKGPRLTIRLSDDWVQSLGAALETGLPRGLEAGDLLAGRRMWVDFYGANATKALHIGHLRNLAMGHGLAAVLTAAGAEVRKVCHGADVGRQAAEAVAGYSTFYAGKDPHELGLKPDHFVGACYSEFVATLEEGETAASADGDADGPVAREMQIREDLAQDYMERWRAGDEEVQALWRQVTGWARAGQGSTLERLGVGFDQMLYESESLHRSDGIVEDGLRSGILVRNSDGSVAYETGTSHYPAMILIRQDGFPTAHMRDFVILGMLLREQDDQLDDYIQYCGDEWVPAVAVYRDLLSKLSPVPFNDKHHMIFHGMVTLGGDKIKSSGAGQPLIDELFEVVLTSDRLRALHERAGGLAAEELARTVLLGHFLSRSPAASMEFDREAFVTDPRAAGWQLCEAWCRCQQARESRPEPDAQDRDYRFVLLQAQRFRSVLAETAEARDPSLMAKYLLLLCRFYLEGDHPPRIDRLMRTILHRGLASLGLRPTSSEPPGGHR